jgi:hypothetical protein
MCRSHDGLPLTAAQTVHARLLDEPPSLAGLPLRVAKLPLTTTPSVTITARGN